MADNKTAAKRAAECHLRQRLIRFFENSDLSATRLADAVLASGVLGVPADQARADALAMIAEELGGPSMHYVRARAAEYRKKAGAA